MNRSPSSNQSKTPWWNHALQEQCPWPPLHQSGINMDKHTYFNWQTQWHCKRWYFLKTETPPMTYYHWHEAPSLVDCVNPNLKTDHPVYIYTYNHSKTNKMIWSGQLVVNSSNIPTQPTREVLKDHHIETNQPTYLPPYRPRPWDHQWNICHHGPIPGILVIFKWLWFIGILKKLAEKKEDFTAASRHS